MTEKFENDWTREIEKLRKKNALLVKAAKGGRKVKYPEALKEMEKLATGRGWSLTHNTSSWSIIGIHGYIAGTGSAPDSPTYAGAIENVKAMLGLIPCDPAPEDGTDSSRPNPLE